MTDNTPPRAKRELRVLYRISQHMAQQHAAGVGSDCLKKHRGNAAAVAHDLQTTPRITNYAIKRLRITPANYRG